MRTPYLFQVFMFHQQVKGMLLALARDWRLHCACSHNTGRAEGSHSMDFTTPNESLASLHCMQFRAFVWQSQREKSILDLSSHLFPCKEPQCTIDYPNGNAGGDQSFQAAPVDRQEVCTACLPYACTAIKNHGPERAT